jgi:hypothetical protein
MPDAMRAGVMDAGTTPEAAQPTIEGVGLVLLGI